MKIISSEKKDMTHCRGKTLRVYTSQLAYRYDRKDSGVIVSSLRRLTSCKMHIVSRKCLRLQIPMSFGQTDV